MISDRRILREQAILGLTDAYYLGSEIIGLSRDELPRPEEEVRPIYDFLSKPRPDFLSAKQIFFQYWSSPRYTAKSFILGVIDLQEIIKNPNYTIIWQSQQKQMAIDMVSRIKEWLEMPEIVRLYGEFKSDKWGREEFTVSQRTAKGIKDPTMRSLGLDDPTQGKRCHEAVLDDIVGDTNSTSVEGLKKAESRIYHTIPLVRPGGRVRYACTRWNPYDPSTEGTTAGGEPGILRRWSEWKRGSAPFMWDCAGHRGFFGAYAVEGDQAFFPNAVPGEPLFPTVLPEEKLQALRAGEVTRKVYASQYLNEPIPEEDRFFSESDFQYFDAIVDGKLAPELVGAIPLMAVDPASARPVKNADDSTLVVIFAKWVGRTPNLFVVDWQGGRWRTDKVYDRLFAMYDRWKPRRVYPEVNTGGAWFIDPIKQRAYERGFHMPLEEMKGSLHGTGKKKQRIGSIVQHYTENRVWHDNKLKNSKGELQLLNYSGDDKGHDDWADVLAYAMMKATERRWGQTTTAPKNAMDVEERYA